MAYTESDSQGCSNGAKSDIYDCLVFWATVCAIGPLSVLSVLSVCLSVCLSLCL